MFNNVTSFHESASETLYRDRSRGSEFGPILGCRHPVARTERPQVANSRDFVIGTRLDVVSRSQRFHQFRLLATSIFATGPVTWMRESRGRTNHTNTLFAFLHKDLLFGPTGGGPRSY